MAKEEKKSILEMVADGQIKPDEGLALMEALEVGDDQVEREHRQTSARWLKVRVTEKGKHEPTVMVNLPFALIDWALAFGTRLGTLGGVNLSELGVDIDTLRSALAEGGRGKIIDVSDGELGNHLEVFVE